MAHTAVGNDVLAVLLDSFCLSSNTGDDSAVASTCNSITDMVCQTVQVLSSAEHGVMAGFWESMPLVAVTYVSAR